MPASSIPAPMPPPPMPPVYADIPSLNPSLDNVSLIITISIRCLCMIAGHTMLTDRYCSTS
jgi:hypothetical protein